MARLLSDPFELMLFPDKGILRRKDCASVNLEFVNDRGGDDLILIGGVEKVVGANEDLSGSLKLYF